MKSINEQISSIEETISLLEEQKHQYVSTNKFLQAAELNNLMAEKRSSKSNLQEELSKLSMTPSQAARHKKRKSAKEALKPKAKVKKTANFFKSSKPKPATVDEESAYEGDMDILSQSSDEENPPKGSKDSNKEESRMSNEKDNGKEKTTNVPKGSEKNDKEEESRNMVRPYFETFSLDDIRIYDKYFPYVRRNLSHGNRVNPDLVESHIKDLTLDEFIVGRKIFCYKNHKKEDLVCKICQPFIDMAAEINSKGIVPLLSLYRKHHSNVAYKSDKATSYVMQLPVCIFKLNKQLL